MFNYYPVKSVEFYSDGLFKLEIHCHDIDYTCGDCVSIGPDHINYRPYSIASAPDEGVLRFYLREFAYGEVSSWLAKCKPGDKVFVSKSFGWFKPGQDPYAEKNVFFATGTGISPFISYFRSIFPQKPTTLFYGVRNFSDIIEYDLLKKQTNLHLSVSREEVNGANFGRITDQFDKIHLSSNTAYYLCGLDEMIEQVADWLERNGIDFSQIHREVFFYAD